MECEKAACPPVPGPEEPLERQLLGDLGFCGHYLRFRVGGKTGHGQLLFIIERAGGSVAQRELQSALGLTPATTSELLGRLESEGLLTRERDARDSRRLVVNLTPLGREQAREKERIRVAFEQRAFTCLSECERETLFDLLETVKTHWEQLDDSKTLEECTRV